MNTLPQQLQRTIEAALCVIRTASVSAEAVDRRRRRCEAWQPEADAVRLTVTLRAAAAPYVVDELERCGVRSLTCTANVNAGEKRITFTADDAAAAALADVRFAFPDALLQPSHYLGPGKVAERREQVRRLHEQGRSYAVIAARLGVSAATVYKDVAAVA